MKKTSHSRPNLDHLRRQAKELLRALPESDAAARTFIEHLPAARGMSLPQVRAASLRLADAQSAIARKEGFAKWPALATHVATLRAMEGTWRFESLQIDGAAAEFPDQARLLMDGDRFRMQEYEGVFNIDVEAQPARIDIHFVEGPEAGSVCEGIFALDGDQLTFCLAVVGHLRPTSFVSTPGSGHALEVLRREDAKRPDHVSGGTPKPRPAMQTCDVDGFAYVAAPVFDRLAGEWIALTAMRDGQTMPAAMLAGGRRIGKRNETRVSFGGRVTLEARMRIDETQTPMHIDYLLADGSLQRGLMAWEGEEVTFCASPPGQPRPTQFASPAGSGITLSRWRRCESLARAGDLSTMA